MTDGFTMHVDQVRAHSAEVAGLAGNADTAADAGSQLADLNDAYGLFCQPFAMMLKAPQEIGAKFLQTSAEQLHRMNRELDESAAVIEEADRKAAEAFTKLVDEAAAIVSGGR
ncbi:hypothetical protein LZ318_12235 [Saccharopolyspora indica]|uniref:type VII secretion target n=1 Tax=Saccharopolyspora indica TaxID=1229659 RepID=UPI0022EB0BD5|nr:type VII secretion target [Saccharopolyspora indica]MDA3643722.1 type VII secretion target [Saccharopolyspora indica]